MTCNETNAACCNQDNLEKLSDDQLAQRIQQGLAKENGSGFDWQSAVTNLALTVSAVQRDLLDSKKREEALAINIMNIMNGFNALVNQLQSQGTLPPAPPSANGSAPGVQQ